MWLSSVIIFYILGGKETGRQRSLKNKEVDY
jgi:hypothetical protein